MPAISSRKSASRTNRSVNCGTSGPTATSPSAITNKSAPSKQRMKSALRETPSRTSPKPRSTAHSIRQSLKSPGGSAPSATPGDLPAPILLPMMTRTAPGFRAGCAVMHTPTCSCNSLSADDDVFKTNATFSVVWFVGRTRTNFQPARSPADRMREPVMRNDYVVLSHANRFGGNRADESRRQCPAHRPRR